MKKINKIKNMLAIGFLSSISLYTINSNAESIDNPPIIYASGGSSSDSFSNVIELSSGDIISVGRSSSANAGFTSKGGTDAIIAKHDKDGNELWVKNFGGSSTDDFYSVTESLDGGVIAVGYSDSTDAGFEEKGYEDAIIVKYDKDGNELWVKNFGGSECDYFNSVTELSNGDIVAVGNSISDDAGFEYKGGFSDAIIVKCDKYGDELWIKSFGGLGVEYFNSVIELSNGDIIAVGTSYSNDAGFNNKGNYDAIIVKYDNNGNELWVKNFGGFYDDSFYSAIELSNGDIIAVGESDSEDAGFEYKGDCDAIIVKYDTNGNELWVKSFGGYSYDSFYSAIELSNGDIIAVGESLSTDAGFNNKGSYDAIIAKYDKNGSKLLVKNFGGLDDDCFSDVTRLSNGDIITVGYSNSTDAGFANKGDIDAIIVKYKTESQSLTASLDIYITCENILTMSLSTNYITFEDFSMAEDTIKERALKITVNSTLPYQLNAYLESEIQNSDGSSVLNKEILNIKESSSSAYQHFPQVKEKVVLVNDCNPGEDIVHNIDFKLKGGYDYKIDVYKTAIKFEVEQK